MTAAQFARHLGVAPGALAWWRWKLEPRDRGRTNWASASATTRGWLKEAFALVYRIVDAMFEDAKANAFCIATDATGAPVRVRGARECAKHHVFVFIAEGLHVVFRHAPTHNGPTVQRWLSGSRSADGRSRCLRGAAEG